MEFQFKEWLYSEASFEYIQKLAKDHDLNISDFSRGEIVSGFETEHEHGRDKDTDVIRQPVDALKIAVAHLREDPHYYKKLKRAKL